MSARTRLSAFTSYISRPYPVAIAFTAVVVVWMLSGILSPDDQSPEHHVADEQNIEQAEPSVKTESLQATAFTPDIRVNGRTGADREVMIKAEVDGRVLELKISKGAIVKQGDVIALIDPRDRNERVKEAKEKLGQAQVEYNASHELQSEGFNSRIRLSEKQAALEAAKANLKMAQVALANTTIRAPFDGIIAEKDIDVGDYVRGGDPLVNLIDLDPVKVTGYLSEGDVVNIKKGDAASVKITEGEKLAGTVHFISPLADVQTRTFPVEVAVPNADYTVIAGLTAEMFIPGRVTQAYKIASSVLTLDTEGRVGVKVVDAGGKVAFMPVRILSETTEGIWVGGLPDQIRLITSGQEFVTVGQTVKTE